MKPLDFVVLVMIAAAFVLAVLWARRRKKQGRGCCGDCGHCGGCENNK